MFRSVTLEEKQQILRAVIGAIDHYTDEPLPSDMSEEQAKAMKLTKQLGIGPVMIAQLSVPLTKISVRFGGRGVGVYSVQGADSVYDCYALVVASITGEKP